MITEAPAEAGTIHPEGTLVGASPASVPRRYARVADGRLHCVECGTMHASKTAFISHDCMPVAPRARKGSSVTSGSEASE